MTSTEFKLDHKYFSGTDTNTLQILRTEFKECYENFIFLRHRQNISIIFWIFLRQRQIILNISQAQAAAADNPDDDPTETLPDLEEAAGEEGAGGETIQMNHNNFNCYQT